MEPSSVRVAVASVEAFVAECAARAIAAVAMRVIDEIRPRRYDDGRVEVGPQKFVELYAYRDGIVIAAELRDLNASAVEAALRDAGLQVRRRSGNVG